MRVLSASRPLVHSRAGFEPASRPSFDQLCPLSYRIAHQEAVETTLEGVYWLPIRSALNLRSDSIKLILCLTWSSQSACETSHKPPLGDLRMGRKLCESLQLVVGLHRFSRLYRCTRRFRARRPAHMTGYVRRGNQCTVRRMT